MHNYMVNVVVSVVNVVVSVANVVVSVALSVASPSCHSHFCESVAPFVDHPSTLCSKEGCGLLAYNARKVCLKFR